jgi:hypothetical protein
LIGLDEYRCIKIFLGSKLDMSREKISLGEEMSSWRKVPLRANFQEGSKVLPRNNFSGKSKVP